MADRGTVDDCDDFCGNIGGGANTRPCGDENKGVFILAAVSSLLFPLIARLRTRRAFTAVSCTLRP